MSRYTVLSQFMKILFLSFYTFEKVYSFCGRIYIDFSQKSRKSKETFRELLFLAPNERKRGVGGSEMREVFTVDPSRRIPTDSSRLVHEFSV